MKKNEKTIAKLKQEILENQSHHQLLSHSSLKRGEKLKKVANMKEQALRAYLSVLQAK